MRNVLTMMIQLFAAARGTSIIAADTVPTDSDLHRPYVLWSDTLPGGEAAKLLIWPQAHQASAILHVNGTVHSAHICADRTLAIAKGHELRDELRRGEWPPAAADDG